MDELIQAIQDGDYQRAHAALATTAEARTPIGAATGAFLLALLGRFADAERQLAGAGAPAFECIVRGERDRAARWRDPVAAGLPAAEPLPFLGMYAGMAVALVQQDVALIERIKRDMATIAPVRGRLRYHDGTVREFASIVDSDDSIGQLLEAYVGEGLLYLPLATLRRIDFLPVRSFVDRLMPKAQITDRRGGTAVVFVPLLYAGSTAAADADLRTGRQTRWSYVGAARRGHGQRDFVLDGGVMVGQERVASIELG